MTDIRLSPTQIELIERCERQWYYDRVLKLREYKPSASQQLGIEVEDIIAAALFEGKGAPNTKPGGIAKAMLALLPKPGTPNMVSQQGFEFPVDLPGGNVAIVNGKKDLVIPGVEVHDFKTTSDFKWAKTEQTLAGDIQSQVYALDEVIKHKLSVVPLQWTYGRTKGAQKAQATRLNMAASTAERARERATKAASRMLILRDEKPDAKETQANIKACDAYGGCPHRAYCPARTSRVEDFFLDFGGEKMGLRDKLKNSLETTSNEEVNPKKEVQPEIGSSGKPVLVADKEARCIACEGTGWNSKGGPCKICGGSGEKPAPEAEKPSAPPATGVNPPDAALSPDDQPQTEAVPVEEKPKRTRRTKAEIEAAKASEGTQVSNDAIEAASTPKEVKIVSHEYTLLVDGAVIKGAQPYALEPMIRKAALLAAEKAGAPDWRLVDYGKGAGFLLLALAELWEKDPPTASLLTISSATPETSVVLSWLIDRVAFVVRAVR